MADRKWLSTPHLPFLTAGCGSLNQAFFAWSMFRTMVAEGVAFEHVQPCPRNLFGF
jgi:hypothetical protein